MAAQVVQQAAGDGTGAAQQAYYTHCGESGYNIRAASTANAALLQFIARSGSYELPLDLRAGHFGSPQAPRRLARVPTPDGQVALLHTAYLEQDTCGRPHSFFTHAVVRPTLTACDALACWASPAWAVGYPAGAANGLPALDRLPAAGPLTDLAVTDFLRGVVAPADAPLATRLWPPQLTDDPARRRALLLQVLRGCLLTADADDAAPRGRLYILAEPGLTALLLYAAARLLPEPVGTRLTFSTYEYHRELKGYKLGRVVGTYTGAPGQYPLDGDLFTGRGYAVEVPTGRASPELSAGGPAELERLAELAAAGQWARIDHAYRMVRSSRSPTAAAFTEGLWALEAAERLARREATAADLMQLGAMGGAGILAHYRDAVWEVVRHDSLANERLRAAFAGVLRGHLDELQRDAAQAVAGGDPAVWRAHWGRLRSLFDPAAAADAFRAVCAAAPVPASLRLPLLREWVTLVGGAKELPAELDRALLSPAAAEEVGPVAAADLPAEWRARWLARALNVPATRDEGFRRLRQADAELLGHYWRKDLAAQPAKAQAVALKVLLQLDEGGNVDLLRRLLAARCRIEPAALHSALKRLEAYRSDWLTGDALAALLEGLKEFGEDADAVWAGFYEQLDRDAFWKPDQQRLFRELSRCAALVGEAAPARARQAIALWSQLLGPFLDPAAPGMAHEDLRALFEHRAKVKWEKVLRETFANAVAPRWSDATVLAAFAAAFHRFYPRGDEYQLCRLRFLSWLGVIRSGQPEEEEAHCQRYYLQEHVPQNLRGPLAHDLRKKLRPGVAEAFVTGDEPVPGRLAAWLPWNWR